MGRLVVAGERHRDVDLQREPRRRGIDAGDRRCDHPAGLQPPDAVEGRRRRQAHDAGELDVGAVGVALQLGEQAHVNFIK